jgi:kinetochore protein Spc25
MLREQVASERAELDAADGALKSEESVKARQLEAHLGAVALYRERLGLRFEVGDDEDLRFFFKHVQPDDRDKEFVVAVRVMDAGGYELVDCDPHVPRIAELLRECNATDNLSGFVRGARAAFRSLVAAEEVAEERRRAEERAKEAPELPPAPEPAPTPLRAMGEDMVPL